MADDIYWIGFLSLALAKRFVEAYRLGQSGKEKVRGRGYVSADAPFLLGFGASASLGSIISFVIYGLLAEERLINNQGVLFAVAFVMTAWLMRLWLIAGRNELDDDPVLFAVKDRTSLVSILLVAGLLLYEHMG